MSSDPKGIFCGGGGGRRSGSVGDSIKVCASCGGSGRGSGNGGAEAGSYVTGCRKTGTSIVVADRRDEGVFDSYEIGCSSIW